jgi:hypothetical protein
LPKDLGLLELVSTFFSYLSGLAELVADSAAFLR